MTQLVHRKLSSSFIDQMREGFEKSFYFACKYVFEQDYPESWLSEEIHRPLCDFISNYKENTRCLVIVPRGWLKSTVCSIYYPVWRAMLDENFTCLIVLNTFTNSTKKLAAIRALLQSNQLLRKMYPERMLNSKCKVSGDAICLPRKSAIADETFAAAGVGTQVTSRHVNLILEDDTTAPEFDQMTGVTMQPTKEQVEKSIGYHKVVEFILSDIEHDQRVVVGTRWLERDLLSHIMVEEPDYKTFSRASLENENGDPDPNGEPVYPERFNKEMLAKIKKTVGEYMFSALMLNSPLASTDMIFRDEDICYYETEPKILVTYTTVDPAVSDSGSSDPDYNVVLTCGFSPSTGHIYVLDIFHERCNPGGLIEGILGHCHRWNPVMVGIESVAYQATIKYWLEEKMRKTDQWYNVEQITASRIKKEAKIRGLQPLFQSHRIKIRSYMQELRSELLAFPRGAHDDIIDALSMQLPYWRHAEQLQIDTQYKRRDKDLFGGANILNELREKARGENKGIPFDVLGVA